MRYETARIAKQPDRKGIKKMMPVTTRIRQVDGLFVALVFVLCVPLIAHAATNIWSPAGSLATARWGHTATLLPSGKVLVAAGQDSNNVTLTSAELYDPTTNAWSGAANFIAYADPYGNTATLLPSGKVLSAGWGVLQNAELYDPVTNTWYAAANLAAARDYHTATLLSSGKVLVVGGIASSGYYALASAELYDPPTNTWSAAASLTTAREGHTATLLLSGKVLVAGGSNIRDPRALSSAELYDPSTNIWSAAGSLATGRQNHTATLLSSGKVLVAGGFGGDGYAIDFASAELYDPATNTWSAAGSLATARDNHTATLLPSGQVLVAGGYNGGSLNSAELYDPATNTWSAAASLATSREGHTATLLPAGQVLVAGGYAIGVALATAEIYTPVGDLIFVDGFDTPSQ